MCWCMFRVRRGQDVGHTRLYQLTSPHKMAESNFSGNRLFISKYSENIHMFLVIIIFLNKNKLTGSKTG